MFAEILAYVAVFIISLIRPFWGFVGLVVSLILRFQDRSLEIATLRPFSFLVVGLLLGCYLHRDELSTQSWKQDKLLMMMLLVGMAGLAVLAPQELIPRTWTFVSSLMIYYFASRLLRTETQFAIVFMAAALSISYLAYEAVVDVSAHPLTTQFIDHTTGRWQGIGYYANANEFGQLMIATIPFLLAIVLSRKSLVLSAVSIAMMVLMVYVVGKSQSRTVMVALGVILVSMSVLQGRGNVLKKALLGVAVGGLILVALNYAPEAIQERLVSVENATEDVSFQGRTRAWGYGFSMLSWYPFTGVGMGQWLSYHGLMPHNSYVQIMAEMGPLGILLFLWVVMLSIKEFRPLLRRNEPKKVLSKQLFRPVWGGVIESDAGATEHNSDSSDNSTSPFTRLIASAVLSIFLGWLLYIFLGNQGYSVWTYFYFGVCSAVRNLNITGAEQTNINASHTAEPVLHLIK